MDEIKTQIKDALTEGIKTVTDETNEKISTLETTLADIKANQAESERRAEVSGLTKSDRADFGKKLKGIYVEKSGPQGLKADDYILTTATGKGEELVGEQIAQGIYKVAENTGVVLSLAKFVKMNSQTYTQVVNNTTGKNGAFVDEGNSVARDSEAFAKISVIAKKWKKAISVSEDAIKFSEPVDLANYIISQIGECFGAFIDEVAFAKITSSAAIEKIAVTGGPTKISYDNLVDMTTKAPETLDDKLVFVGNREILGEVRKLKDGNDRPLVDNYVSGALIKNTNNAGKSAKAELLNYPFYTTNAMNKVTQATAGKPFLFFGSIDDVLLGILSGSVGVESDKNIIDGVFDFVGTTYTNVEIKNAKAGVLLKTS